MIPRKNFTGPRAPRAQELNPPGPAELSQNKTMKNGPAARTKIWIKKKGVLRDIHQFNPAENPSALFCFIKAQNIGPALTRSDQLKSKA